MGKFFIQDVGILGLGLIAGEQYRVGQHALSIDGSFLYDKTGTLPDIHESIAFQVGPFTWRSPTGAAKYLNHSCEPNLGMSSLYDVQAIRNIEKGEHMVIDYAMFEEENCLAACLCGSRMCRGIQKPVGGFLSLPYDRQSRYMRAGWVSPWLVEVYLGEMVGTR